MFFFFFILSFFLAHDTKAAAFLRTYEQGHATISGEMDFLLPLDAGSDEEEEEEAVKHEADFAESQPPDRPVRADARDIYRQIQADQKAARRGRKRLGIVEDDDEDDNDANELEDEEGIVRLPERGGRAKRRRRDDPLDHLLRPDNSDDDMDMDLTRQNQRFETARRTGQAPWEPYGAKTNASRATSLWPGTAQGPEPGEGQGQEPGAGDDDFFAMALPDGAPRRGGARRDDDIAGEPDGAEPGAPLFSNMAGMAGAEGPSMVSGRGTAVTSLARPTSHASVASAGALRARMRMPAGAAALGSGPPQGPRPSALGPLALRRDKFED